MFFIVILGLISAVATQFNYPQQQQPPYPVYNNNNNNQGFPYSNWNQPGQYDRASVRGNLLSNDPTPLPYGSQIIVSLADVSMQDAPARPLNTLVLSGSYYFPIAYEIPYSMAQVQANSGRVSQYAVQVRIEKDGQLLYINDQYTPVRLLPTPVNPVNVVLKRVGNTGGGGIYSTNPPIVNNGFACQQLPDAGPCKARIEQFFFNAQARSCQVFYWGGCAGNQNRFSSRDECERACMPYRRRFVTNAKQRWMG